MKTAAELKVIFDKINADCAADGEGVVPLSDIGYYAGQIEIMLECDSETAEQLATEMAAIV